MAEKTVATQPAGEGRSPQEHARQEHTRAGEQHVRPPVDIYETQDGLTVLADLPGVKRDDLRIEVRDNVLTIDAHATDPLNGAAAATVHREFELVSFFRQFQLSDAVDTSRISADFKHGVLTLRLPKAEAAKPKQIQVQVGS